MQMKFPIRLMVKANVNLKRDLKCAEEDDPQSATTVV
jgi:hypothetical protein